MNNDKAPFGYYWVFFSVASVTSIFPLHLGGVVCVFIWVSPVAFLDLSWRKRRMVAFPLFVFVIWVFAIMVGSFLSGTNMYFNPL
jgi:hypothetical protein